MESLKQKILNEMVRKNTPKENLENEIRKEIWYMFNNEEEFNNSFEKAWKKFSGVTK